MSENADSLDPQAPCEAAGPARPMVAWEVALIAAICLAGFLLRVRHIGQASFWVDEAVTVLRTADEGWGQLWRRADFVMYWIQKAFFVVFPHTDAYFRLPAAVSGAMALVAIYLVGRELLGRAAGLAASVLLCIAPFHVYYSQEARHYAHQVLFTLVGTWFLIRAVKHGRRRDWLGFACFAALNVFNHAGGLVILALQLGTGFLMSFLVRSESGNEKPERKRPLRWRQSVALPLAVCAFLIYGAYALKSFDQIARMLQIVGLAEVEQANSALKESTVEFGRLEFLRQQYVLFAGTMLFWIPPLFLVAGLGHAVWRARAAAVVLILFAILPPVAVCVTPLHWYPYWRYFLWVLPFFCLIMANGIVVLASLVRFLPDRVPARRALAISLVGVILAGVFGLGGRRIVTNLSRRQRGQEWRGAAKLIKEQIAPGEVVLVEGTRLPRQAVRIGLKYYFRFGEPRAVGPPRLMYFPGADKLDTLKTTATTAWRAHRIPHTRKTVPRSGPGGGVFPGIQVQRFMLAAPRPIEIPNGGFEIDSGVAPETLGLPLLPHMYDAAANNGIPDGWHVTRDGQIAIALDDSVTCQGRRSLRIDVGRAGGSCQLVSLPVPAEAGYICEASAKVRVAGDAAVALFVAALDRDLKPLLPRSLVAVGEENGWRVHRLVDPSGFSQCRVTPAGTVAVRIGVRVERRSRPGARVWFDDMQLAGAWPLDAAQNHLRRIVGAGRGRTAP